MARAALLLVLLTAYAAGMVRPAIIAGTGRGFDALAPESRFVEEAIGGRRFDRALPVALELRRGHPTEPLAAYWLATIYRGLGRSAEARAAWDDFERLAGDSSLPRGQNTD